MTLAAKGLAHEIESVAVGEVEVEQDEQSSSRLISLRALAAVEAWPATLKPRILRT